MAGAALDAAYDSGAAVADAPRYRADWAARSERMRARHAATMDIPYGDAPRAKLDLFLAASPPAPTLIFIHGGDRKSTRLNSSHQIISYAVFCFKKNNQPNPAASHCA